MISDNEGQRDSAAKVRRLVEMDKSGLSPDGGAHFNRLIFTTSPYLLQHAENPVDWFPWGEEAFAKALAEDRPVFLSIGYATCHWCHVMEGEAFEDQEVADVMNRRFVSIKVDREERPDIDDQYMAVAQMMTGSGGWPLNIFMTPGKKPFFAATYMPRTPRMGMPGVIELMEKIGELWRSRRELLLQKGDAVVESLRSISTPSASEKLPGAELPDTAFGQAARMFDPLYGGFGEAPKFPMPHYISFLLRYGERRGSAEATDMATQTLKAIRNGGIYDHLGLGLHRYAVDRAWLVPHFEKMLYDQALAALAYMDAFRATSDPFYREVSDEICSYVLADMTAPDGGFYSAQDADTEGEEGKYYLWTPAEIKKVVGDETAPSLCRLLDVTEGGNFEGRNILHLPLPMDEFAQAEGVKPEELRAHLERARKVLLKAREERIKPLRDEKALTSWNGLMIAALARGFSATNEAVWLEAAKAAADFVGRRLVDPSGRLMHSFHMGRADIPAFLEDYAFYVWGLLELYEATLKKEFLEDALSFSAEMLRLFGSVDHAGLYDTGSDAEELLVRTRKAYDGVIPSGNSVAAFNLLRLGRITGDPSLAGEGEAILRAFIGGAAQQPVGYLHLLSALDYHMGPEVEVTLAGRREEPETAAMLRAVGKRFIPGLVLRFLEEGESSPFKAIGGRTTAYVCAGGACRPPSVGAAELEKLLDDIL